MSMSLTSRTTWSSPSSSNGGAPAMPCPLVFDVLRRRRRARHRRDADRAGRVGRKLWNLRHAASDVAVAVAVEEVEDQAGDRPEQEQQLRLVVQIDEQEDAAGDRQRRDEVKSRSPERP